MVGWLILDCHFIVVGMSLAIWASFWLVGCIFMAMNFLGCHDFFEFMGLKFCRIVWVAKIFWVYGLLKIVWNFLGCSCVAVWRFFLLLHL